MSLKVEILTPKTSHFFEASSEVIAPATTGQVGVLPGHADYLTSLKEGPLTIKTEDGQSQTYQIEGGLMTVTKNAVAIMVEHVEQK